MSDIKTIVKSLEQGICPPEFNFRINKCNEIDWQKVRYNTFFRSHEFFEEKFPQGFENIPGFDKIVNSIVEKNQDNSPLKEITQRAEPDKEISESI